MDAGGRVRATALAAELASALPPATRIVSSPSARARETADAIAAAMGGAPVTLDDRWCEVDFGAAEGLTFAELERLHPGVASRLAIGDVAIDWPGGEPSAAFRSRVLGAWTAIVSDESSGPLVVVSHAGPIREAIAVATGTPASRVGVPDPGATWWAPPPRTGDRGARA